MAISDPTDIGVFSWFDAKAITGLVDTDPISSWASGGTDSTPLTQTGALRPIYKTNIQNGLPAVEFNGHYMQTAAWAAALVQPNEFYVVMRPTNITGGRTVVDGLTASLRHQFRILTGGPVQMYAGSSVSGSLLHINENILIHCKFDGASSQLRINNALAYTANPGAQSWDGLKLGTDQTLSTGQYIGYIMEVCVFDSILSTGDRSDLVDYFVYHWKIPEYAIVRKSFAVVADVPSSTNANVPKFTLEKKGHTVTVIDDIDLPTTSLSVYDAVAVVSPDYANRVNNATYIRNAIDAGIPCLIGHQETGQFGLVTDGLSQRLFLAEESQSQGLIAQDLDIVDISHPITSFLGSTGNKSLTNGAHTQAKVNTGKEMIGTHLGRVPSSSDEWKLSAIEAGTLDRNAQVLNARVVVDGCDFINANIVHTYDGENVFANAMLWLAGGLGPDAPVISGAALSSTEIRITVVQPSLGATYYDLHRSTTPNFSPLPANRIAASLSSALAFYDDSGLTASTLYFYKLVAYNGVGGTNSNEIGVYTDGYGVGPFISVGNTTATTADLVVSVDAAYTEVQYQVTLFSDTWYQSTHADVTLTSSSRFSYQTTGLTAAAVYKARARWKRPSDPGFSSWSNEVTWIAQTASVSSSVSGFTAPIFGEPIFGQYLFKWNLPLPSGETYSLEISNDLGDTWNVEVSGLASTVGQYLVNTTGYSDGINYMARLVGTISGSVYTQWCFYVDNALLAFWHPPSGWQDAGDPAKYGLLYNTTTVHWFYHATGKSIAQVNYASGLDIGMVVAKEIKSHTDLDLTTRFTIDSGEGGASWETQYGADGAIAGIAALAKGSWDPNTGTYSSGPGGGGIGIATYVQYGIVFPFGTCGLDKGATTSGQLIVIVDPEASNIALANPRYSTGLSGLRLFSVVRNCGQFPIYDLRQRVTHPDRTNYPNRVRIQAAIRGLGLAAPAYGSANYWQVDQTVDLWQDPPNNTIPLTFDCGCAGVIAGKYAGAGGAVGWQEFHTIGAKVLDADCSGTVVNCNPTTITPPPSLPPTGVPFIPAVPAAPCPAEPCPGNVIIQFSDSENIPTGVVETCPGNTMGNAEIGAKIC